VDGLQLLEVIQAQYADISVIMMTGQGTIDSAVKAMREGALNYLLKPVGRRQLLESVAEAVQVHTQKLQKLLLTEQFILHLQTLGTYKPGQEVIVGQSSAPAIPPAADQRFLQIRDLIIDQHRLVALFQGHLLELTPTEFEILYHLVQAEGRVVTFEDIAFRVRGIHAERDEARTMLSSHFANLRSKLRQAGGGDYLVNRRSSGYFIKVDNLSET
jgi:DNA-binding response OmpR family regulator